MEEISEKSVKFWQHLVKFQHQSARTLNNFDDDVWKIAKNLKNSWRKFTEFQTSEMCFDSKGALRHSLPLMLLPPTLWVALRGARSAADAATATLEYQYLVYASSFSSCHCSSDHIVYHLSFIIFQLFPRCCIFCILGGSTGWFSGFFSTSTPKVRWDSKGAMGCQSDRSLQELSNEY